jgi:hypothetical protein
MGLFEEILKYGLLKKSLVFWHGLSGTGIIAVVKGLLFR